MHPELQRRAQRLLVDLLDVPESSREAILAARCGDDQELRGEVLSLLRAAAAAEGFLDTPAIAAARETFATTDAALVGREFGGFRLIEELGRGGMGIVYRATQRSPERDVAVKVTPCAVSLSARRRFEAESRALARMRHPSIAAVHEAGVDATTGIAWIAMEFVDGGRPITVHAREHRLSLLERLRLFREACDAVHHGHLRGVIHRDLKPSNILVGRDGRVKIIDFGIARLLGPDDTGATMTADGTPLGTLSSMSPEQCGGDSVDLRTDVYSLGVVLHELVAGSPPFAVQDRSLEAALRMIRTESPPPLRRLVRDTPRDLETIVLTALEKDPRRRYQSIAALADDLVRLEQHRPIEARPARWTHHVALFARRHVAVVAASACVLLVLLAATFVSLRFAVDAQRERDAAIRHSYVSTIASAGAALDAQELYRLRQQLDRAPSELRGWEWQYLDRQCRSASVVQRAHGQRVTSAAWHPRSDVIATGDLGGTLHLWSADGTSLGAPIEVGQPINGLAWRTAPDSAPADAPRIGDSLLAIGANRDPLRILRCNQDGLPLGELPERYPLIARGVAAVDLSSDGVSLVYAGERGATLFRLADAHVVATVDAIGAMRGAAFSPDGDRFALTHEHAVEIRRTADGSLVRVLERGASFLDRIAWHPNGEEIAVVDNDGTLAILGVDDGELRGANRAHTRAARAVAYSPDGSRLLTGGDDHQVILWERATLAATRLLAGHHDAVTAVSFAPDGMRAVSASLDGTARVWDLAASDGMSLAFGARWRPTMRTLAFSPDGTRLLAANEHGHAKLLDAESWATLSERETPGIGWWQAAFSPDGSLLAVGHGPEEILLFGRDVHEPIAVLRHGEEGGATGTTTRRAGALAFSLDGTMLASGGGDYGIRVWDLRTEPPGFLVAMPGGAGGHGAEVTGVAFSPDGGRLYSCSVDRSVACWEVDVGPRGSAATARRRWTRVAHEDLVLSLAVHPSDGSVVSGGRDLRIVRFRGDDGVVMDTLASHGQSVSSLVFSADGSRLFTASTAGDVKVWEWPACIELLTLRAPTLGPIRALAMRPDGTELVAAGSGAITRWSTTRAAHLPVRSSATAVTPERGR